MSCWSSLPYEILQKVLTCLKNKDKIQCQLTCHGWTRASQASIYVKIDIYKTSQITKFMHTISSSPSLPGEGVKQIYMSGLYDSEAMHWHSLNYFNKLIKYCPNLEELSVPKTYALFWAKIMRERYEGNLKYLNKIQYPSSNQEIEWYTYAVLSMCDTIKQVLMCDSLTFDAMRLYSEQFLMLVDNLDGFKRLEELKIMKYADVSLFELVQRLDTCTRLKELQVTLHPLGHLMHGNQEMDLTKQKQLESIKRLNLSLFVYTDDLLSYIMHTFPSVHELTLNNSGPDKLTRATKSIPSILSPLVFQAFVSYLEKLKMFDISDIFVQNMTEIVRIYHAKLPIETFSVDYTFEESFTGSVTNELRFNNRPHEADLLLSSTTGNFTLAYMDILREIGSTLLRLEINTFSTDPGFVVDNAHFDDIVNRYFLENILRLCPRLEELHLIRVYFYHMALEDRAHSNLGLLEMVRVGYYPPSLRRLSACTPSLRHVELLSLTVCDQNGFEVDSFDAHVPIDMPYSCLESFSYSDDDGHVDLHDCFYLKLCTMEGEEYFECIDNETTAISKKMYDIKQKDCETMTFDLRFKSVKHVSIDFNDNTASFLK